MFKKLIAILIMVIVVFIVSVVAKDIQDSDKNMVYAGNQMEKLGKGLVNTAFGWTDVLKTPYVRIRESGNPAWLIGGFVEGVFKAATRTGGGGIDALTFPIGGSLVEDYPLQE